MTSTSPKTPSLPGRPAEPGLPDRSWMRDGLCASAPDPDLWFPEQGQSAQPALEVCARCPVTARCLDYVLNFPSIQPGVWGGTTEDQRPVMRRGQVAARRRAAERAAHLARPEVRERRREAEAARRRRLREAATAGDPQAIAALERQRAARAAIRQRAAARRQAPGRAA